jgi:hypothetical protein
MVVTRSGGRSPPCSHASFHVVRMTLGNWLIRVRRRQMVRPWALSAPVAVLLIALPLLRPLRSPGDASENELSRLATIEALVENKTLTIDSTGFFAELRALPDEETEGDAVKRRVYREPAPKGTIYVDRFGHYSDKPPVMAFLLSWAYEAMYRLGWNFEHHPTLVAYVLTLLGVTLPVAGAAGLIYRMGRLFELRRPWRAGLALAVVLGSGLISYSVVLNSHAPAAALVLSACACLLHVHSSKEPTRSGAWLMVCGLSAGTAAVIDLSAAVFLVLLALVILALRWNWGMRIGGVMLYLVGATPPLVLHAVLTVPVTGDMRPGFLHAELTGRSPKPVAAIVQDGEDGTGTPSWLSATLRVVRRSWGAAVGSKGLLTHYPVVVIGLLGVALVLRRHWPASTKMLAGVTLAGAAVIVAVYVLARADWTQAMFGPRWFVVFLPLLLFWAGAWLRKPHHRATWACAAVLLAFSTIVSLIGAAAAPFGQIPSGQYTVLAAVRKIAHGETRVGMDVRTAPVVQVAGG